MLYLLIEVGEEVGNIVSNLVLLFWFSEIFLWICLCCWMFDLYVDYFYLVSEVV